MKPIIGVTPLFDDTLNSFWMMDDYLRAIKNAGGIPVVLGFTEDPHDFQPLAERFDGFVFTGGQDFDTELYGQKKKPTCGKYAILRDKLEFSLMPEVLKTKKPLLGICRGMQLLNCICGGTLYQDLPTDFSRRENHDRTKPYDDYHHAVHVDLDNPFGKLLGRKILPVNSLHHQGVDGLGDGLTVFARSATDGLVEGFHVNEHPFALGIQWHPEFLWPKEPGNERLWKAFIEACTK